MQRQKGIDGKDIQLRIERITDGTTHGARKSLLELLSHNQENAVTVCNYITSMIHEINPSIRHIELNILISCKMSRFFNHQKVFDKMTRDDMLSYLDTYRKSEEVDPQHRWISTYNTRLSCIGALLKWLAHPDMERKNRPKPTVIQNIPWLKRKEVSAYKPTDMWFEDDISLFLKYCPSSRNKCYTAMAWDTGARPHELLKLKMKDVVIMLGSTGITYALVNMSGKTGSRSPPLIESIPYVKDWWSKHPLGDNPDNVFLCAFAKSMGKRLHTDTLSETYKHYKEKFFPKLLKDPNIPEQDKILLRKLLAKPWNPYILRHSALTRLSTILKESSLRQQAGWTKTSNMPNVYIHYFGQESSNELLKVAGVIPKDKQSKALQPKQCPNCNEANKPDAKFCLRCKMILSYDGYNETLEKQAETAADTQDAVNSNEKIAKELADIRKEMADYKEFQKWKAERDSK